MLKYIYAIFLIAFAFAYSQPNKKSEGVLIERNKSYNYVNNISKINFNNIVTISDSKILSGMIAPLLGSPQNKTLELSLTFNFNWSAVVGATNYWFQVAKDSAFVDILDESKNAVEQNVIVQTMDPSTKFYWRVCGKTNIEKGPWSEIWTFTTRAALPLGLKLVSPDNAIGFADNNADFQWTNSAYATKYQIQIANNITFDKDSIALDSTMLKSITNDTSYFKIRDNKLKPNSQYYWHVRGVNNKGNGPWSEIRYFLTGNKSSVDELISSQIEVIPNPTNGFVNIKIPLDFELKSLDVIDINGNLLIQFYNSNINISNLPIGYYNLIINSDKHQIIKKIIKN